MKKISIVLLLINICFSKENLFAQEINKSLEISKLEAFKKRKVRKLDEFLSSNNLKTQDCNLIVYKGRYVDGVTFKVDKNIVVIRFRKSLIISDTQVLNDVNNFCLSSKSIKRAKIKSLELLVK